MTARSLGVSGLHLLWRGIREPTVITSRGKAIGVFIPAEDDGTEYETEWPRPYRPEPTPEAEAARLALEIAELATEVEELRTLVAPDRLGQKRASARRREALRRRDHLARLHHEIEKEKDQ